MCPARGERGRPPRTPPGASQPGSRVIVHSWWQNPSAAHRPLPVLVQHLQRFAQQLWAPGWSRVPSRPRQISSRDCRGSSPGSPRSGMFIYNSTGGFTWISGRELPSAPNTGAQWCTETKLEPAVPGPRAEQQGGQGPGHAHVVPQPSAQPCPSSLHPDLCQLLFSPDTPLNPSRRTHCCSQFGLFFSCDSLYICIHDSGAESNDFEVTSMQ